jgi:ankyrin repeat protein
MKVRVLRSISVMAILLALAAGISSCQDPEKSAKKDLARKGYEASPEAFFRAAGSNDVSALDRMLDAGLALDTRDAAGDTGLHAAARSGMTKSLDFFLNRKLPIDVRGGRQRTPLMAAVAAGQASSVRYLLRHGADPRLKDENGLKPLMIAVSEGRAEMIPEIAAYDRENLDEALLIAAITGKPKAINQLTNFGASLYACMDDGRTALMAAAENGQEESVKMLLELGANRYAIDPQGRTAADYASQAGHDSLATLIRTEPKPSEYGLESTEKIGAEMASRVDARQAMIETPVDEPTAPEAVHGQRRGSSAPPALLEGSTIQAGASSAPSQPPVLAGNPIPIPLVMRDFRQKELPLQVLTVQGNAAVIQRPGHPKESVRVGETIPGTRLLVVQMKRRFRSTKERNGEPIEFSTVSVRDSVTGLDRDLITGVQASAHDPVALVEDASSGQRYIAKAGQHFRSADGTEYEVTDVRPNQIVVEKTGTDDVWTVPLRGPRG